MDVKGKKIGLILNDLSDVMLNKIKIKIKELKRGNAEVFTITKTNVEPIINQFQDLDVLVIISCTRQLYKKTNRK